ncbi:MAG: PAS domain S-box protein [Myxococcota bacterium]|nr:PAS domain S-box protein [Myxococcota bacterium]
MKDIRKTKTQLIEELEMLRKKVEDCHEAKSVDTGPDMELLRRMVDCMLEPTVILDWDGFLLHGNVLAAEVIGASRPEELVGMNIGEFVHPDSTEQAAIDLQQVKNSEADFSAKYKLLVHGRTVHIQSHGTKIELDNGSVDLVSFRDVTNKNQANQELRRQAQLFQSMVENANDIIYTMDTDGTFLYVSPNWKSKLGHDPEEVIGSSFMPFIHPDDLPQCLEFLQQVLASDEKHHGMEYRIKHEDGTWKWHVSNASTMVTPEGQVIFTGIARDITERKWVEEELIRTQELLEDKVRKRTSELERNEKMFRGLTESMNAMVIIVNVENERVVYANPAATEMTGYSLEELTAFPAPNLFSDETARQAEVYREAYLRGDDVPNCMELEFVTKDRQCRWMETSLALIDLGDAGLHKVATSFDITARKQAEESMKESEKKFRALADLTSASIAIVGSGGNQFTYANQTMLDRVGMTWKELSTADPADCLTQAALDAGKKATAEAEEKGVTQYRFEYEEKPGVWREINAARIQLDGEDAAIYTSFDITAHKVAQQALEESEAKFRNLAESTTAHITIMQDDKYVYANQAFLDYMGVDAEELSLITVEELMMGIMGPHVTELAVPAWEAAMKRGDNRFRFEFPDMEGNWFQTNVSIIEMDGKESYMSMTFDITEHKRTQDALASSEKRYRTIFDTAGTGMISFGNDGLITLANEEWTKLSGYSIEETVGKMTWMPFFTEESLVKMKTYHKMRSEDPNAVPKAYEAQFIDRWGKVHDGIINIQLVPGTLQRVASFQDLTELKLAQHEMYRADKMAALGQIIAGVAHEINNPNNFIFFNLPILRKYIEAIRPMLDHHVEEDPELRILNMPYETFLEDIYKLLENMEHGSRRITGIVSELKTYVRSEEDENNRLGSVGPVIDRVMALVGKQVRKTVKRFDIEVEPDLPRLNMNPGKIEQVLINLIINAGQAADKEDSYVKLSARSRELNGNLGVEIAVEDNGTGIPEEIRGQIFEPFFTSKGRETGTGLGLSISQRIVEEHGGKISLSSRTGQGAIFTIFLPA